MKNNRAFSPESVRYSVPHGVPSRTVSSPAPNLFRCAQRSRPNKCDFVVLDPLCRRNIAGIILGLFDVQVITVINKGNCQTLQSLF